MAIPKYNEMYREFLECLDDDEIHSLKEIRTSLAKQFSVTEEEQKIMIPSGKQPLFYNRVCWTKTYLSKGGLVDGSVRGSCKITEAGKTALRRFTGQIPREYLEQSDAFQDFKARKMETEKMVIDTQHQPEGKPVSCMENNDTPQDILDHAYQQINTALVDDLLNEVMAQSPVFFEHLVVHLLTKMGYGGSLADAGTVTAQTGDEGIDGVIREDKLGFNLIYIQAKRWALDGTVGRPELQKFVGALAGQGATKGLFITTAKFTQEARQYAQRQHTTKIILVDGPLLAKLMIEYNVGVSTESTYEIKRIDTDFFLDDMN